MEFSREFMDKIRESFGDLETIYPNLAGLEILFGMEMDDIHRKTVEEGSRDTATGEQFQDRKPARKVYEDLSYIASMESTRCHMLIDKLKATIELLDAQQKYYDTMSMIECDNEHFGFDLSI